MIIDRRCSVCGRLLALTRNADSRAQILCPDRPCILYPPPTFSRAKDPTVSSWVLAIHEMTSITDAEVNRTFGHGMTYVRGVVTQHRKRWQNYS